MRCFERIIATLLLASLVILTLAETGRADELTVSAALSLKAPLEEIGKAFERSHPGTKVAFNFASSGALKGQIQAGAPADVFASASPAEIDSLAAGGFILPSTRRNFAGNSIVLIAPVGAARSPRSFDDLKRKDTGRIAIGNPASVPAGKYATETLKALGVWEAVQGRLVFAEHVRQVKDYVVRGEVEAGMLFATDIAGLSSAVRVVAEAPASSHTPVIYAIAAVRGTRDAARANSFIDAVLSGSGQATLRRHGFRPSP